MARLGIQLLLGGANVAATGWAEGKMYSRNGGGTRGSCLDDQRMATMPCLSMLKDHKDNFSFLCKVVEVNGTDNHRGFTDGEQMVDTSGRLDKKA